MHYFNAASCQNEEESSSGSCSSVSSEERKEQLEAESTSHSAERFKDT